LPPAGPAPGNDHCIEFYHHICHQIVIFDTQLTAGMKLFFRYCCVLLLLSSVTTAQNNTVPIIQPPPSNILLPCAVNCTPITLRVPHIKQSSDYLLQNIPFSIQPLVSPSGTELPILYTDDEFSQVIPMPFNFCFYDSIFSKLVVGSNGVITFDTTNADPCSNAWELDFSTSLPFSGGAQCDASDIYVPRASISGAYHDIDPSITNMHPNRRIEYRIEGTAPSRRMIISFNDIALFSFSCNNLTCNQQIILYEGTNIVEVNIKDKPTCSSWNDGLAIIGIQNWAQNRAVAVQGLNPGVRDITNASYRFLPIAGTSRFIRSELLLNNAVVALGDTSTPVLGELQINFPSVCPVTVASQYVIRTIFSNCSGGPNLERLDTVNITRSNTLNATASFTQAVCASPTGSITVNVPPGVGAPPYQYSINGGPLQNSNTFPNLAAGTYSVFVKDNIVCQQTLTVTVTSVTGITGTASGTPTSCAGVNNGSVTATPTSGVSPYTYSLNGGPSQTGNVFNGLAPGNYTVTFIDFNGCLGTATATVPQGNGLTSTSTQVNPPCAGINSGSLTVTPTNGTGPYTFSLNGGPSQNSPSFTGLGPGTNTVTITDFVGCTGTRNVVLVPTAPVTVSAVVRNVNCFGEANGRIILTAGDGTAPYQYSSNGGGNYQVSDTFNNLIAGTYNIRIRDFNGCFKDTAIEVTQPPLLTLAVVTTDATCNGNDGVITLTANGGTPNYDYSIDSGFNYQSSNIFTDSIGVYNYLFVKDSQGCTATASTVIALNDTMRLELGPDTTICEWNTVTFAPQTNAQTTQFVWTPNIDLSDDSIANAVATPHFDIRYVLTARWGVCERKDTIGVNVKLKPIANAGLDTTICWKSPAVLRGSVIRVSGPVSFLWSPPGRLLDSSMAVTPAQPDTTQLYVLEVSDNYGCGFKVYDSVLITQLPPVAADAGRDTIAVEGMPHQLFGAGGVTYVWTPAGVLDNPFAQSPRATIFNDTRFTVYVQNTAGCLGTDEVLVKVYKGPTYYIPNAFSPNGDGLNDVFRPTPVGIVRTNFFRVFNRYGELMFETRENRKGWDGVYKGKKQDQGTYTWVISGLTREGRTLEMKGTVILIR
jgi:gliding motility-associated-like protein